MEGMRDKFSSPVYSNIVLNEEVTGKANHDYFNRYHRKENLFAQEREQLPEPVSVIKVLAKQLSEDTRSDSTGTYTELKKMAIYFVNNYSEFDVEMEVKIIAALHARACDYYNLHSSRPRHTTLGKNRMMLTTSIMHQLQKLVNSFDDDKKNMAMMELCSFDAPKPLYRGEAEYQTDVSANSEPLRKFFADYSARSYLEENSDILNPTDEQVAEIIQSAPFLDSKTAAHLLRGERGVNHYANLEKLLPEGVTMDQYLSHSLFGSEPRRVVQIICPKFNVDKLGNPLTPADAVNMAKAKKNMEIMASGDVERMKPIIDEFVQSLCDVKVPDLEKINRSGLSFEEYALKHLDELRDYTYLTTNFQNIIGGIPVLNQYYEGAYTKEFRDKLTAKSAMMPTLSTGLNAIACKYGVVGFGGASKRMNSIRDYNSVVEANEPSIQVMLQAAKTELISRGGASVLNERIDANYEKSVAKYGKKHVVFVEEMPSEIKADEFIVPYMICPKPHRAFAREVLEPFMDASKIRETVDKDVAIIEKIMDRFHKKRCIFDDKYPVPNISECERILKEGIDEEKIALEISLAYHLDTIPVYLRDDPFKTGMSSEVMSENHKKLIEFKKRLDIAVYGDYNEYHRSSRKGNPKETDVDYIKPSKEMGKKVMRMLGSFALNKNLARAKFLKEEVEKTGKKITELTDREKGIILAKSVGLGIDGELMVTRVLAGGYFGIMSNTMPMVTAILQGQDMFKDDFKLIAEFGDGASFMGAAHRLIMGPVPLRASEETRKQMDEEALEVMRPYIDDFIIESRMQFRKTGMLTMPFTNELMKKFESAVAITDFTDKHNEGRKDTFYKLVVEPLEKVIKKSSLSVDNKRQRDYPQSLFALATSLDEYKRSHNPHSTIGKQRLQLVNELADVLRDGIERNRDFELGDNA